MSLNPLNELKRRLEDDSLALPKRLCLAKNVVHSHYFPAAPKERLISEWLDNLIKKSKLSGVELKSIIGWLSTGDDLSGDLKTKLIQVVSEFVQKNQLNLDDTQSILDFLENEKILKQLTQCFDENLNITVKLLQTLNKVDNETDISKVQIQIQRTLNNLVKHYKLSKKKLDFIIKLIAGENLESIFNLLETENRNYAIELCQNILFPINKKSFFISLLQTMIRKDNIDELIEEKGDNIQSVLKIMSAFFTFPNNRSSKDFNFLCNFIDVFVTCFQGENQLIFAFYIMVINSLKIMQNYLNPNMTMPAIMFEENDDKIKRGIFLKMLEILLRNEVDITVRLTDTFGEKISKTEIKKNFSLFLQGVMVGVFKLDDKPDKTTINIIKTALKLDPILIEQKLDQILPPIMATKKNSSSVMESYKDMLKCLLETLFKLSRGTVFINQIIPNVKLILEAGNPEQFELIQKVKELTDTGSDCQKIKSKIITGNDVFPHECVELYGKWSSELMFRQNCELLMSLHKDFELNCLMMLEEGFVSPSIIILTEVLAAILSSFFHNNKMADHTVPRQIAVEFWTAFEKFENECLRKLGECTLKLNYNPPLILSFLKICDSFSRLKLLNMKYGNIKLQAQEHISSEVFDFSAMLPCLNGEQWITFASRIQDNDKLILDQLVANKTLFVEFLNEQMNSMESATTKTHLIKQLTVNPDMLECENTFSKVVFENLDKSQLKQLSKCLIKHCLNNDSNVLSQNSVINNRTLLNYLLIETLKNITKYFENGESLTKAINKSDFDIQSFLKDVDTKDYFNEVSLKPECNLETINKCMDILKQIQVYYLEEKYQLATIFVMLIMKKSVNKKLKRNIDHVLQSIYELSSKYPDLYKIFPVEFIFSFEDKTIMDLLTLKIKTSNNLLIIRGVIETGVKKVKTDSEIVKSIVEILLSKHSSVNTSSVEYFSDPIFQISCIILPIIAKEKKAITTSAYRSILANLQEKIHKSMLNAFKNIDFKYDTSSFPVENSAVLSDNALAALNAIEAYSLTLSKYCETNDIEEIKNLECLWSGLDFFLQNAIQAIQNPDSKSQHVESSIHLLNVTLRYIKKLESHDIFKDKDKLFLQIWQSLKFRLLIVHDHKQKRVNDSCLESIAVALKFLFELSSPECFGKNFVGDLSNLATLKEPQLMLKDEELAHLTLISHKVSKYLISHSLKANIVGPKCVTIAKLTYRLCKNVRIWIQDNFEYHLEIKGEMILNDDKELLIPDIICDLLRVDLDLISEVILAAKRITLDYKFLDSIFELQHLIHFILGCNSKRVRCILSWQAYFQLFDGSLSVLNSLLISREEILEDRWPCYMQCYRALVSRLCDRASAQAQLDKTNEDRLAEAAHLIEKLTQSISKRKTHISRLATYAVADICSWLERSAPSKMVRQHLENSVVLLIQITDSTHAMAFLRRVLAGSSGQMTMTNLYTMYKRYHKYVGNA